MTTTSEKILKTIKDAHLKPQPRWKFLAKNYVLWGAFCLALLVGGITFGVTLYMLSSHDWDIYQHLHKSFLSYLFFSLPYIWIICLGIVATIAYYNFVHLRGWYHHRVYLVVLASAGGSIALGTFLFYAGIGQKVDQTLTDNFSYYNMLKVDRKQLWDRPNDGLLGGEVVDIKKGNGFVVKDFNGNVWNVENVMQQNISSTVRVGEKVKIIGSEKDSNTFEAKEIRYWDSKKDARGRNQQKKENSASICTSREADCVGE